MLNSTGIAFIMANCVATVLPATAMEEYNYNIDEAWLGKSALGYLPFVGAVWVISKWIVRRWPQDSQNYNDKFVPEWLLIGLIWLGGGIAGFYVVNYGGERIMALGEIVDRKSAYVVRYSFDESPERFGGLSYFTAAGLVPICFSFLIGYRPFSARRRLLKICALPLAMAYLRLVCGLQRSNIIIGGSVFFGLAFLSGYRPKTGSVLSNTIFLPRVLVRLGLVFAVAFVSLLSFVYAVTDSGRNPLVVGMERVFAIPSHTAALYFGVFDRDLAPRGLTKMHAMSSARTETSEIGYWEMGAIASTDPHCANANFIAVAFSGGRWIGSALISILVAIVVAALSVQFGGQDLISSLTIVVGGLYGLFVLIQTDLNAAIFSGWFSVHCPLAGYLFLRSRITRSANHTHSNRQRFKISSELVS